LIKNNQDTKKAIKSYKKFEKPEKKAEKVPVENVAVEKPI
jgi:hypothetical protein